MSMNHTILGVSLSKESYGLTLPIIELKYLIRLEY